MNHGARFVDNGEVRGATYHEELSRKDVLPALCLSETKQSLMWTDMRKMEHRLGHGGQSSGVGVRGQLSQRGKQ